MGKLVDFLKTGSIGPIVLGMNPFEVTELLGEPDQESKKKNPLTLKYGSLELVFWKGSSQPKSQLRDIVLNFVQELRPLPSPVALDDFGPPTTERQFSDLMFKHRCRPVADIQRERRRQLTFLSGVVAVLSDGALVTVRNTQREKRDSTPTPLSDVREPTRAQILEMINEADRAGQIGATRAALVIAWAGMEATLRRAALQQGRHGQIGVQPQLLIRELVSAGVLTPVEARILEEIRQLRTASAHGLAPVDFDPDIIAQINDISRRALADTTSNVRKQKEVADIIVDDAIEAYSVIVRDKPCRSLFDFLTARGLKGRIELSAIGGSEPHHDIQIEKTIEFKQLVRLLNEWKESYIND